MKKEKKVDLNKSYESLGSQEFEEPHYNFDSDGEPPTDYVGDELTIIKKRQVVKKILETGEQNTGKPGKPYIVKVSFVGYLAASEGKDAEPKVHIKTAEELKESLMDMTLHTPAPEVKFGLEEQNLTAEDMEPSEP